jgi:general secretion pathway protein I
MARMRRASLGFTLIEALVAMVILGGAGVALFGWINASIVSVRRVELANERSAALANAIEYMQSVNPMALPAGRVRLGNHDIAWTSSAITPATRGSGYPQGHSLFELALYETSVQASRADDRNWFDFKMVLVGYRRTADVPVLLP